jgi:hypothetical protein
MFISLAIAFKDRWPLWFTVSPQLPPVTSFTPLGSVSLMRADPSK